MEMHNEEPTVTFLLQQDASGRQVYTLHTESNAHYPYDSDETHEIIEQDDPEMARLLGKRIKLEHPEEEGYEEEDEEGEGGIVPEDNCLVETYEDQIVEDEEVVIQEEDVLSEELVYEQVEEEDEEEEEEEAERAAAIPGPVSGKRKRGNEALLSPPLSSMGGIITQHMDIREPLNTLRSLLEERLGVQLNEYQFWLQDTQVLEGYKNLVDQCVQGEGLVQVNVQIKSTGSKKINIVDVLKPAEDYGEPLAGSLQVELETADQHVVTPVDPKQNVVRWHVDSEFKKVQERLKIPTDPAEWSVPHVQHWLQWAVRVFNLVGLRLSDWHITGRQLCDLGLEQFQAKVPQDPGDLFWTHLELLRKCKFVAVVHKQTETIKYIAQSGNGGGGSETHIRGRGIKAARSGGGKLVGRLPRTSAQGGGTSTGERGGGVVMGAGVGNRTGNNGQIQLWQFLLELLTDRCHTDVISWISSDGEFKLKNPEHVAQLWGERKNKPTMNYEKLSRALRYYYDGDMISKVHGKRFVYKFVCDMKSLLGYDTSELSLFVNEPQRSDHELHNFYQEEEDC